MKRLAAITLLASGCATTSMSSDLSSIQTTVSSRAALQNFSLPNLPFSEFTVAVDHTSLSGYVAATAQPLVIADVYLLRAEANIRAGRPADAIADINVLRTRAAKPGQDNTLSAAELTAESQAPFIDLTIRQSK